jgi:hypothetical protein
VVWEMSEKRESNLASRPANGRSGCWSQGREVFVNRAASLKLGAPKSWDRKET